MLANTNTNTNTNTKEFDAITIAIVKLSLRQLAKLKKLGNAGLKHKQADQVLCNLLVGLGFQEVVEAYNDIKPKWYE